MNNVVIIRNTSDLVRNVFLEIFVTPFDNIPIKRMAALSI